MRSRLAHLPVMLLVSLVLMVLAAAAGAWLAGAAGALGAAAGVALAGFSYTLSTLVIAWADSVDPRLVLPFGLATYVTKIMLFGFVMVIVLASDWPGMVPMGLGIAAGVVLWNAAQIWWVRRHDPTREFAAPSDTARGSGEQSPPSAR